MGIMKDWVVRKIYRLGALHNRNVFPTGLEAKAKIEVPSDLVSGESPLHGLQMVTVSLCSQAWPLWAP